MTIGLASLRQASVRAGAVLAIALSITACAGPASLHQAVLGYDETISQLERELLLINVARISKELPTHFTVTSSIAATFDYTANAGLTATLPDKAPNVYGFSLGASASENPTLTIVPVQGEEFTRRILTPMDEDKFEFLVFQGVSVDMLLRLMADGIEMRTREGQFERFVLNWPSVRDEYEEFRRRVLHLWWLNAKRKLFVGPISFEETVQAGLKGPPPAGVLISSLEKGFRWRKAKDGTYDLVRTVTGRVAITNYDLRTLGAEDRRRLNARAAASPKNFVLVDIRPGYPGGDYPLFGAFKLRSLNSILKFIASGLAGVPEFDVAKDPRTGEVRRNPARALTIESSPSSPPSALGGAFYNGIYYWVADSSWDRRAFKILYQLFQMTVTDVSKVGVPVTISK